MQADSRSILITDFFLHTILLCFVVVECSDSVQKKRGKRFYPHEWSSVLELRQVAILLLLDVGHCLVKLNVILKGIESF